MIASLYSRWSLINAVLLQTSLTFIRILDYITKNCFLASCFHLNDLRVDQTRRTTWLYWA
nr:MAG TPA: hypothetical protein [Caudoviricetes sp.]